MFYCEDRTTGQQKSLQTKDETEASKIVQAKNDAVNQLDDHPDEVPATAHCAEGGKKVYGGVCFDARSNGHPAQG